MKCHADLANRCNGDSKRAHLCAVYLESILPRIGMGIMTIVDVLASHAYDSLQISNRAVVVDNPCPSVVNNAGIVAHQPPVITAKERIFSIFSVFFLSILGKTFMKEMMFGHIST